MFVVAVYDIATITDGGKGRLVRIMKSMRCYLHHTQKSVFEGEISEAKFFLLQQEIKSILSPKDDYVVFYCMPDKKTVTRKTIGKDFDPNKVII